MIKLRSADYGRQIFPTLSEKLMTRYGRSFKEKNLRRMLQFSEQFEDLKIVTPLATQLSWSHFIEHENSGKRNSETIKWIKV